MIKFLPLDFFRLIAQNSTDNLKHRLAFTNICIGSGDEMTDDVIHSTKYYIKYINSERYLCQFAAETIETWQANSPKCNTPTALTIPVTVTMAALYSLSVPPA